MGNICSSCFGAAPKEDSTPALAMKETPVETTHLLPKENSLKKQLSPRTEPVVIQAQPLQRSGYSEGTFSSKYDLKEIVGAGSTSSCHRCVRKGDSAQYACKVIDKRQVEVNFSGLLEQFHVEVKVLSELKHPNIIHLEDVYETSERIYMVMEIMTGGELFDYVVEKGTLSEEEASCFIRQITSALAYMHKAGVIHRDLKPENLLLKNKEPNGVVKIIDFGLAKVLANRGDDRTQSFLGTRGYLAPEMLQRNSYDKSIDIWALGVITFVLLCGCLPFDDDSSKLTSESAARAKFVLRFPRWASNLSQPARDLLENLLNVDPKFRFTAAKAEKHPWVTGKSVLPNNYLASPGKIGDVRIDLREPVSPTMKAMHDRLQEANGVKTTAESKEKKKDAKDTGRTRKKSF